MADVITARPFQRDAQLAQNPRDEQLAQNQRHEQLAPNPRHEQLAQNPRDEELVVLDGLQSLLLTRGLAPGIAPLKLDKEHYNTFRWIVEPEDQLVGELVFTDGSLIDSNLHGLCDRLGWAFTVLSEDGRLLAAAAGVPPDWVVTIQGAELWGLHMAVQNVLLPKRIYIDCQSVLSGLDR
eukprot:2689068-Karenia_brevis.AAC.1